MPEGVTLASAAPRRAASASGQLWKAVSVALVTACGAGLPCGEALGAECSEIPAVQPVAAIVKHARTAAPARLRRRVMFL
jgi:hypothetical protein